MKVRPFLMFEGKAEEAMTLYTSLLPDSAIGNVKRHPDGKIMLAELRVGTQAVLVSDSAVKHAFTFTPSISFFVDCDDEAQLRAVFGTLSDGGNVMMPIENYGFSRLFGWTADRFGVSWQLNLP
jgi:predicted 3-demethylubiquinone-9 3-methyltransferase (glyoxalase superfamily)